MALVNFQIQVFLFAALVTQSVLGLKCYICNSANDPECSLSPPPSKFLLECSTDTLEILNDLHRQTKIHEAARLAAILNGTDPGTSGPPLDGHPGMDGGAPRPPPPHPFDKDDKELTLNRTARDAAGNATKPVFSTSPINLPKQATFCRRTAYHIPAQANGPNSTMKASVRMLRSCGWIPEPKKDGEQANHSGCKWIGTEGVQMDQCVCTGDGCNSGNYLPSLTSHTLILLAVMTFGYFYVL